MSGVLDRKVNASLCVLEAWEHYRTSHETLLASAYIVVAYIVMAYTVMAYTVMAYVITAYRTSHETSLPSGPTAPRAETVAGSTAKSAESTEHL